MKKPIATLGGLILGSAIIWGAVIIGCSLALRDTECYDRIQNILVGGVLTHIILIWGPVGMLFRKLKGED